MIRTIKRLMQGFEREVKKPPFTDLAVLDAKLYSLRRKHRELAEFARELSDGPGGEVYDEVISELTEVELAGRALREEREKFALFLLSKEVPKATVPPQLGERLFLLLLTKEERVNIPGDLEEEFTQIAAKHGERFAKIWYYKQVVASAWPLISKAIKWGCHTLLREWVSRFI